MPKVGKLMNELYKDTSSRKYPVVILDFIVPGGECDVNVTPDKRKVFFSDEASVMGSLREGLNEMYSSCNASYIVNRFEESSEQRGKARVLSLQEKSSNKTNNGEATEKEISPSKEAEIGTSSTMDKFKFDFKACGTKKGEGSLSGHDESLSVTHLNKTASKGLPRFNVIEKVAHASKDLRRDSCYALDL